MTFFGAKKGVPRGGMVFWEAPKGVRRREMGFAGAGAGVRGVAMGFFWLPQGRLACGNGFGGVRKWRSACGDDSPGAAKRHPGTGDDLAVAKKMRRARRTDGGDALCGVRWSLNGGMRPTADQPYRGREHRRPRGSAERQKGRKAKNLSSRGHDGTDDDKGDAPDQYLFRGF